MRRQRSDTIEADSFEEYVALSKIAIQQRQKENQPDTSPANEILNMSTNIIQTPKITKPKVKLASPYLNYWKDMDYNCLDDNNSEGQTPSTAAGSHSSLYKQSTDDKDFEEMVSPEIKINQIQVMIVGAPQSGRHIFLNSSFESAPEKEVKMPLSMDLVIRHKNNNKTLDLFKLWILDACTKEFAYLFKIYYKSISKYIFIYQVNKRSSFECLHNIIQEIKTNANPKDFTGYLIGGKPINLAEHERQVSFQEGEDLQKAFGLSGFVEKDFVFNQDSESFFCLINKDKAL